MNLENDNRHKCLGSYIRSNVRTSLRAVIAFFFKQPLNYVALEKQCEWHYIMIQ